MVDQIPLELDVFIYIDANLVILQYLTEGSLVIIRAYPALNLSGTPSQETGTRPPSCLLLENRLYIYTFHMMLTESL